MAAKGRLNRARSPLTSLPIPCCSTGYGLGSISAQPGGIGPVVVRTVYCPG